jgi:REP element-mobilizing transposase RayT
MLIPIQVPSAQTKSMPKPRKRLISLDDTPYYHCIARCVRRAFLCGQDPVTGFDFEHRRQWIVDRMKNLASSFAVDLCAYAVMNNHYHIVLKIDVEAAGAFSDREVAERWMRIFTGSPVLRRWLRDEVLSEAEHASVAATVAKWRKRLYDLSWFMRCLNESVARMANKEDQCTGRFWEGRFKSQALLDERAVLACMAYVDLNPVRAGMATTPETSEYTSIKERTRHPDQHVLYPMIGQGYEATGLPFSLVDYLEFVDWAGRGIRQGKRGSIAPNQPPILQRLHMDAAPVMEYLGKKEEFPFDAIGPVSQLRAMAAGLGMKFLRGVSWGAQLCPELE